MKSLRTPPDLPALARTIESCELCPRLRRYCETVAREKRKAYATETYWGRPIPGFGDPAAELAIVGLAPAAHGANRTGRIFTGDRSGEWLYRALFKAGVANQAKSDHRGDGLRLTGAWVTCAVRCAPPDNKPNPDEYETCRPYLHRELDLLTGTKAFVALGGIALGALQIYLRERDLVLERTKWKFGHAAEFKLRDGRKVFASFHPSQQNTFTKRLTEPMFDSVFRAALTSISAHRPSKPPASKGSQKP